MKNTQKSTHRVKIITGHVGLSDNDAFAASIEKAYSELNDEALQNSMIIVNQSISAIQLFPDRMCYILTCQWMARVELESAQMRNNLMNLKTGGTS